MTTQEIIQTVRKHLGGPMESSARVCLADAIKLYDNGELSLARQRAIKSLLYSIGIFEVEKLLSKQA